MLIRAVTPADDAAIWALLGPVFRAGDTYSIDPQITAEEAVAYWRSAEKTTFIAEMDGEALGTYYLRPNQAGGGAHVCNCGYITAEAAQGRGIARAMLAHSLKTARAQGYRAMQYNFVVSTNTRAIDTWTRAGFDTVGRLPGAFLHPTKGYVDALVLYRSLV
ncbi:GNAT family N-acetyltransferase [Roseicyclus mahoneyensis]|uniref:Ribosomal protein S18 acetylase RimI-like enzyme n=1 Tax=Roseicyclus mahoneyensis TaxID=164332 RepID=A0A316H2D5_9RHOB|nr:GNAT family N-acetyltransferase [Roseicyclus mahoneyensis]PWK61521.1 ribosomal protein S18 acetylase RimI-like enzyme [Roseicyclus mahoneyensis]